MINVNKNKTKGFTLVEMMVSVAIFSVIMTMGIGSLLSMMQAYKVSQKEKQASDSLNFVLESMTREMRLGVNYYSGSENSSNTGFSNDGTVVSNYLTKSNTPTYLIGFDAADNRGYIIYSVKDRVLYRSKDGEKAEALTDISQVIIQKTRVRVMNTSELDGTRQPLVWLQFLTSAPITGGDTSPTRIIQTLVSQRILDL